MDVRGYARGQGGRKFWSSGWKPPPWDYHPRYFNGNGWSADYCRPPPFGPYSFGPYFSRRPDSYTNQVVSLVSDDDDDGNASMDDIIFIPNETNRQDLVLNTVTTDTVISISDESDVEVASAKREVAKVHWNDVDSPAKWTKRMKKYYNRVSHRLRYFCHIKALRKLRKKKSVKDRWTLLDSDVYPPNRKEMRCLLCRKAGHVRANCPKKNLILCHMCGHEGHKEMTCPFKMCLNCGAKMEIFTRMCNTCAIYIKKKCTICNMVGHKEDLCPNHWRQYHSVINKDDKVALTDAVPARKYCCNCGNEGHVYEECEELRWSTYAPVSCLVLRMPPTVEEVSIEADSSDQLSLFADEYKGQLSVEKVEGEQPVVRLSGPSQLVASIKGCLSKNDSDLTILQHPNTTNPRVQQGKKAKKKKKKKPKYPHPQ